MKRPVFSLKLVTLDVMPIATVFKETELHELPERTNILCELSCNYQNC